MTATNIPFVIDLDNNQHVVLSSLTEFTRSLSRVKNIGGTDPVKKAIIILQRYITSLKNFKSVSDERQAFFSSNQFLDTFITQLDNLKAGQAPITFEQFQSESKDESKSAISLFLDTIFLKSYEKQSHSWRTALAKYLKSSGTLCTTLQPTDNVDVADTDRPSDVELENYRSNLNPAIGAVARQNLDPSQLINYSFSGVAGFTRVGFTRRGVCYLCGLPIERKTATTSTKKKNKDESRALNGVGNTNCEHVMPFLSALQNWDFIYKALDAPSIRKKFEMSDEFAWSHFCCNMLKQNIDFLHLDTNGLYIPHYHNIETYLNWLSSNDNRGKYDCLHVLPPRRFNRDTARGSIMERVNRLCEVLNSDNTGVPNNKNNYSQAQLRKVYGIFLLLQYVNVADFTNIIKLKTQIGIRFAHGLIGGADMNVIRDEEGKIIKYVRSFGSADKLRGSRVNLAVDLRKSAQNERLRKNRENILQDGYATVVSEMKESTQHTDDGQFSFQPQQNLATMGPYPPPPPTHGQQPWFPYSQVAPQVDPQVATMALPPPQPPPALTHGQQPWFPYSQVAPQVDPQVANIALPPPQPPPAPHPSLPTFTPDLKLLEILKSAFYQTINELDQASITQIINRIDPVADQIDPLADHIETSIEVLNNNKEFKTRLLNPIWDHPITTTGKTFGNYVTTITLTKARSALQVGVGVEIPLPPGTNIESICKRWFSNMIYDYFDIKLTINDKQQISVKLQQELLPALTEEARSAINQAQQKIASEISNLTQLISSVTLGKEGQMATATNPLTTLQAMIKNANLFIFLPMVNSLTTKMEPEVMNISCIDYIDDIIFYLELLTASKDVRLMEKILPLIQLVTPTLQPPVLGSIYTDANAQIRTIPFITEALSALPEAIKSGDHANVFDNVVAKMPALSDYLTSLSSTITTGWGGVTDPTLPEQTEPIERNEQIRDALTKLKELIVGRQNLETLSKNLSDFGSSPTINIETIQTSLILPLKLVQTCLTDTFTSNLKTAVDTALDTAVATASTQGGGKRNHKRKSGGYRKTIRRNHKRIIRVAKGGAATYRKKHNKSRNHKTRKHKIRKHKTRKHKRL
jgi:hypothetical protein